MILVDYKNKDSFIGYEFIQKDFSQEELDKLNS
jgi:hypothetical protein